MILIVDDKAENIFSLRRTLELNGFEVDAASSGEEALKKILKQGYSLIILDVQMPGMDGFEVAETLSGYSKAKDIPIIFLSAVNVDKKFITQGYTSGGIDYVTKPIDPDIFLLKVKTLHKLYEQNRKLSEMQTHLLEEIEIRKEAEENQQKIMQEQRSILESLPQIAFTLLPNGDIEYVNEHWLAYAEDKKTFPISHSNDINIAESLRDIVAKGTAFSTELRIKNKGTGDYRHHLLRIIPVQQGDDISKWVGTYTDIQEQKAINEMLEAKVEERTGELLNKNKELENSNYELQQFASVASHDLKEPLRKIQVFSSIIKDRFINDNIEAMPNIDKIIDASRRMSELINDLLDYSRLSIDSLFEKTSLRELVKGIINDFEFLIKEKNAEVTLGDIPEIDVVPGQMRQVFQNLISNSLKFSKEGISPIINITAGIYTDAETSELMCRIDVSDNGIGFKDMYKDKIFTIFQRLHGKTEYEGTGIGLAIVKKILEKHNGTIIAEGREDQGATFIMTLPLHHTKEEHQQLQ